MFTRKRWQVPALTGDWKTDGPQLLRVLSTFFLALEDKQVLAITEAYLDGSPVGSRDPDTGAFTTLSATGTVTLPTAIFTPGLTFGGGSTGMEFGTRNGRYTKVADLVCFTLRLTLTVKGSSTGNALITGLPFTSAATYIHVCSIAAENMAAAAATSLVASVSAASTSVNLYRFAAGALTALADTDFSATSVLYVSGFYSV